MKKNGDAEVVEVAKASGGGFDGLDFGIEAFGSGVGEVAAGDVVEEGLEVGEKCAGEALHGRKGALMYSREPYAEIMDGCLTGGAVEEMFEGFAKMPGGGGLEIRPDKGVVTGDFVFAQMVALFEPQKARVFEHITAGDREGGQFLTPNLIDGLTEAFGNAKSVSDDARVWQFLTHGFCVRCRKIRAYGLDFTP